MVLDTLQNKNRPVSILMVEDNPGDVLMMKRAFKHAKLPHDLRVASSGEQALSMLRGEGDYADKPQPDIILLDLNLPKMSGKDVLGVVKQDRAFRRIPVMVISSSIAEEDVVQSYDLHANGYIVKPVDLQQSIAVVEKVEQFWFTLAVLPNGENGASASH